MKEEKYHSHERIVTHVIAIEHKDLRIKRTN